jgi:hypothetical protein
MNQSNYVILGRPLYMDREFESEEEENGVILLAYKDGQKMMAQGFYLLDFCFKDGRLKIRLGEEPSYTSVKEYGQHN